MKKIILTCILCSPQLFGYLAIDKALWYLPIQFPAQVTQVPPVRVYYAGNKIASELDKETKQLTFAISEYKMRTSFYILIGEIDFVSEQNTIKYLRVPHEQPYKLYRVTFKQNSEVDTEKEGASEDIYAQGSWKIASINLADDRRIPDDTIIVYYNPGFVKTIEGGNALELPKIVLDDQLLQKINNEQLYDASVRLVLSSLNCDTIHKKPDEELKFPSDKTVLSLTT